MSCMMLLKPPNFTERILSAMILNYLSPEQLFEHALSVPDRETIDLCIFSVDNFSLLKDHMTTD